MKRHQIEHVIRAAAAVSDQAEIVVIGSSSLLGAVPDAPETLTRSMDADVYPLLCYPPRPMLRRAAIAAAALTLAACSTKHVTIGGDIKYKGTPEDNYAAGVELLDHGSFPEAGKFFDHVKTKYPFSKFAALADLRLADSKYKQGSWVEAADAYAKFVQLHPTHEEVDYAEFRVGLCYFKDAPSEFILFPPAEEKDERQVTKAKGALVKFLKDRPSSKYADEGRKLLAKVDGRLAAHEWYVAQFYFGRHRWAGAAGRYEALVERYPGSRHEPQALLQLARSYVAMDEKHRARTALQKLILKHPDDPSRKDAEGLLARLR